MIKEIFLIVLFAGTTLLYSQSEEKTSSNVELPDFVITGKELVALPSAKKIAPQLISILPEEFFKPPYSPEELEIVDISNPISRQNKLIDTLNYYVGSIKFSVGIYDLPKAGMSYVLPLDNGIIRGEARSKNVRAYDDNTQKNDYGAKLDLSYFLNDGSNFLSGTQIDLKGIFDNYNYRLYRAASPFLKRSHNRMSGTFEIKNTAAKNYLFGLSVNDRYISLKDENFSENLFGINFMGGLDLSVLNLTASAGIMNQSITNNLINDGSYNFKWLKSRFGLRLSSGMNIGAGINYAETSNDNFFSPALFFSYKINDKLSLWSEYSPEALFKTDGDFLSQNFYFNPQRSVNVFMKNKNRIEMKAKYEYQKYYEINGGVNYSKISNLNFFQDTTAAGNFDLFTVNGRNISVFLNLIMHYGPNGIVYGGIELNDSKDDNGKRIPYSPLVNINLNYSYKFLFGLETLVRLNYRSNVYTNLLNSNELKSYFDLGVNLGYEIFSGFMLTFEAANLLNNHNFIWDGYREKPFDAAAGINFNW